MADDSIGYLDIFVHDARDINNVCIYHKQDVYAKLCLTSDPNASRSTKVIDGGGRNPVFDEGLRLDVRTVEAASLRCEVSQPHLLSCVSTTGSSAGDSAMPPSVSEPSETTVAAASSGESQREKSQGVTDGEADSSEAPPANRDEVVQPAVISVNLQPGESVVQQDIVDMYMRSMKQFTDSLAKMKLPLDVVENSSSPSTDSTDSSTAEKPSPTKGSRVFYGSRAFF